VITTDGVIATGGMITTGGVATTVAGRTAAGGTAAGNINPRGLTFASLAPESAIAARDTKAIRQGGVNRTSLSSTALSCVKRPRLPRRTGGPSVQHSNRDPAPKSAWRVRCARHKITMLNCFLRDLPELPLSHQEQP
jgi:hypothetical protein